MDHPHISLPPDDLARRLSHRMPPLRWDADAGTLVLSTSVRTSGEPAPGLVGVTFQGLFWIRLDAAGAPVALDLHSIPDLLAARVPTAGRGEGAGRPSSATDSWAGGAGGSGITCLLDSDSNWLWIQLGQGAFQSVLGGRGDIEIHLVEDEMVRLSVEMTERVEVPVRGGR